MSLMDEERMRELVQGSWAMVTPMLVCSFARAPDYCDMASEQCAHTRLFVVV